MGRACGPRGKSIGRDRGVGGLLVALALGVAACEEELPPSGELVVVVTSNLAPPTDFDTIHLEVIRDGTSYLAADYTFDGQPIFRLPATMPIAQATRSSSPVTIRAVALRRSVAIAAVRAVSSLPVSRRALLRLELSSLCVDLGVAGTGNESVPKCPEKGQTCLAGACVSAEIPEDTLPDYSPQQVFGGGAGPADGGCFDTMGCFAVAQPATGLREDDCSVDLPGPTAGPQVGINVALSGPPGSGGVCAGGACLAVLDEDAKTGWLQRENRLLLPAAACRSGRTIVVTTSCSKKTASLPTCGPWSAAP